MASLTRASKKRKERVEDGQERKKRVHFGNVAFFPIEEIIGKTSINAKPDRKKISNEIQLKGREDRVKDFNLAREHSFWSPDDLNIFAHALASSFTTKELTEHAKRICGIPGKYRNSKPFMR